MNTPNVYEVEVRRYFRDGEAPKPYQPISAIGEITPECQAFEIIEAHSAEDAAFQIELNLQINHFKDDPKWRAVNIRPISIKRLLATYHNPWQEGENWNMTRQVRFGMHAPDLSEKLQRWAKQVHFGNAKVGEFFQIDEDYPEKWTFWPSISGPMIVYINGEPRCHVSEGEGWRRIE